MDLSHRGGSDRPAEGERGRGGGGGGLCCIVTSDEKKQKSTQTSTWP